MINFRGTTIIGVKKDGKIVLAGDGQVTAGEHTVFKGNARKVRRIFNDKVVIGFAGSTADAFNLCEHFEKMLEKLQAKKEECLMIGDSLSSDIAGAHAVGMDACWFNPSRQADTTGLADYTVTDLSELLEIL